MIEAIKELRARTFLGMTECKKALIEANGSIDEAIEFLQKKGLKKVENIVQSTEGMVYAYAGDKTGAIVEVNCQTDFGAKSEVFQMFVKEYTNNFFVADDGFVPLKLSMLSRKLGESVVISRSSEMTGQHITAYNHLGDKIAVLVKSEITNNNPETLAMLDNVAMQIAAMKPLAVSDSDINSTDLSNTISLYEEELRTKPEAMRPKILSGKIKKWFKEVCLLDQEAVFADDKKSVQAQLDKLGVGTIKILGFIRFERGESLFGN